MPAKTTKKSTAKKSVKSTATKTTKTTKRVKTVRAAAPVMTPVHECGCGADCQCAKTCGCKCCGGCGIIRIGIKIVILCIVFLLGCLSSPWFMHRGDKSMMRHVQFDENGCVVLESVKCPKMLEALATADDDANGCISRAEMKSAIKDLHRANDAAPEQPMAE